MTRYLTLSKRRPARSLSHAGYECGHIRTSATDTSDQGCCAETACITSPLSGPGADGRRRRGSRYRPSASCIDDGQATYLLPLHDPGRIVEFLLLKAKHD